MRTPAFFCKDLRYFEVAVNISEKTLYVFIGFIKTFFSEMLHILKFSYEIKFRNLYMFQQKAAML